MYIAGWFQYDLPGLQLHVLIKVMVDSDFGFYLTLKTEDFWQQSFHYQCHTGFIMKLTIVHHHVIPKNDLNNEFPLK